MKPKGPETGRPGKGMTARLRALLPGDWAGRAGAAFRQTLVVITAFAARHHATPGELADEAADLGRRKLEGLASHEHADAMKKYAEAARQTIDNELARRTQDLKVRKESAEVRKAEAEADAARLAVLAASVDLVKKLNEIGVSMAFDEVQRTIRIAAADRPLPLAEFREAVEQSGNSAIGLPLPEAGEED